MKAKFIYITWKDIVKKSWKLFQRDLFLSLLHSKVSLICVIIVHPIAKIQREFMLRGTGGREEAKKKKEEKRKRVTDIRGYIHTYIYVHIYTQNHANVPLKTYFDGGSNSPWEFKSNTAALYLPLNRSPIVKQHTCVPISQFHISRSID